MRSPFPGIDPYIEASGLWDDFHATFITVLRNEVRKRLPDPYVARVEQRLCVSDSDEHSQQVQPDVTVHQQPDVPRRGVQGDSVAVMLEPEVIPWLMSEPAKQRFIEIYRRRDEKLITVIELLSPSNKDSRDRSQYLAKREAIIHEEDVNLVEIDLLLKGRPLPLQRPLPPGHGFALISRADNRPDCEVYHWNLNEPLPTIPIPLQAPDPDCRVRLQDVFAETWEQGAYDRSIRYEKPHKFPVSPSYRDWIEQTALTVSSEGQ